MDISIASPIYNWIAKFKNIQGYSEYFRSNFKPKNNNNDDDKVAVTESLMNHNENTFVGIFEAKKSNTKWCLKSI